MAEPSLRSIKALCTASEFALLTTTVGKPLQSQSPEQLRRTISLLRDLRDKWRSQTTAQRRRERGTRGGNAMLTAGRSEEKKQAFVDAIARVEAMIERSGAPARRRDSKALTPTKRAAEHRLERATTRKALRRTMVDDATPVGSGAKRSSRAGGKTVSATASAAKSSRKSPAKALPKPGRKVSKSKADAVAMSPPPATRSARMSRAAKNSPLSGAFESPRAKSATPLARKRGRGTITGSEAGADAAARSRTIRASGFDTRVMGHIRAQGRRNQARRDQRSATAG